MKIWYGLLIFVPVAVAAELMGAAPLLIFVLSALAILPLSTLLGDATEHLAAYAGPTVGGLLNATLGNLAELIIAIIALRAGLLDLVKASITGSIIGNLLLVLGVAQVVGGMKYKVQKFSPHLAGMNAALLIIAAVGLVVPALFHGAHPDPARVQTVRMSEFVAVVLIIGYGLSLLYSMGTHRDAFAESANEAGKEIAHGAHGAGGSERDAKGEGGDHGEVGWSLTRSIVTLLVVAVAIAFMSELLVGATQESIHTLGLSELFVGIIVVPIIGNAAEHSAAILMAARNRMDLAVGIAVGSSVQVALLVAPLLVFAGLLFGQPMDLAFTTFEVASVALAVWIGAAIVVDAESNWLEGALLLCVYAILAVAFFFF
ncbi:MAG TPA: calcium/proton exchanger [Gemmatimonadaceae bacterium]|nr:calcium/proton exchanger [Gemmatimonadaceae bacterium]